LALSQSSIKEDAMTKFKQIILGFLFIFLSSGILYATDLQKGFLEMNWGTDISELTGLRKLSQKGDVSYYRNPQITYSMLDLNMANVILGFFKDKFFAAYIAVESIDIFAQAKNHLTQKLGSPQTILKTQKRQTIYSWKEENIRVKLKLFEKEGKMKLAFYYMPIATKVNQTQREIFPQVNTEDFSIDSRTRQQVEDDSRLRRAIDVMGF
jgi:hypothetical protein